MPDLRPRPRAILGYLLLHSNQFVSTDRLVDALWTTDTPSTARNQVQTDLSILRRLIRTAAGVDPISTRPNGYAVNITRAELDLAEFTEYAERAWAATDPADAVELGRSALAQWTGPPLDGIAAAYVDGHRVQLTEQRLRAYEHVLALDLGRGRHAEVIPELYALIEAHPLRENLVGQLMLALHRSGRRGDALQVYRHTYRRLVDDLGVQPGADLEALHHGVLSDDPALSAPSPPVGVRGLTQTTAAPAQLPAAAAGFAGRGAQLSALDAALIDTPPGQARLVIVAGTAGVGKTALAVQWARRVRDRFPDGQLYVDLRGYSSGIPASPLETLARCLRACGMAADRVPSDLESAVDTYRSLLNDRRMLIVLDNARSPDQIRPLLPGGDGCAVVVTSRDRLDGLAAIDGAHRIDIDRLSPADAQDLLVAALGRARVEAEPDAAAELATQCAFLPLALRIAGASIRGERAGSVAAYVERLRSDGRLTTLSIEDDPASAVRAAFDTSYLALAPGEQRFARLLSLAPGNDITAAAAEPLTGVPVAECRVVLRRLTRTHLIEERVAGRYAAHDLLALYLRERAGAEDTDAARVDAVGRILTWYQTTARAAVTELYAAGVKVPSRPEPAAWLDAEQDNLVSAAREATEAGHDVIACDLADALTDHFWHGRRDPQWITVTHTGVAAASRIGDARKLANAQLNLALALYTASRFAEAADQYALAYDAAVSGDWERGQEISLTNLGTVHLAAGDLTAAETFHRRALALKQRRGNTLAQSVTMTNLGIIAHQRGDLHAAYDCHRDAVRLAEAGDRAIRTAEALQYLGYTRHALGDLDSALDDLRRSLLIFRTTNSRLGPAQALMDIAAVHTDAARHDDASTAIGEALDIIRAIGDRTSEAFALNIRGRLRLRLGDIEHALADHAASLAIARADRAKYAEAEALAGLAMVSAGTRPRIATAHAQASVAIADQFGFRLIAAHARAALAMAYTTDGQDSMASEQATAALQVFRGSGHRIGEATAVAILGRLREVDAPGNPDAAGRPQPPERRTEGQRESVR